MSERNVGLGEIARTFLKIGAMSYGGPAIMGIMQAEIQEKRQWIDESRFVERLAPGKTCRPAPRRPWPSVLDASFPHLTSFALRLYGYYRPCARPIRGS